MFHNKYYQAAPVCRYGLLQNRPIYAANTLNVEVKSPPLPSPRQLFRLFFFLINHFSYFSLRDFAFQAHQLFSS